MEFKLFLVLFFVAIMRMTDASKNILIEVKINDIKGTATIACTVTPFVKDIDNLVITKRHAYCPNMQDYYPSGYVCSIDNEKNIHPLKFTELMVWDAKLTHPYLTERSAGLDTQPLLDGDKLVLEVTIRDVKIFDAGLYTCLVIPNRDNSTAVISAYEGESTVLPIEAINRTLPRCSTNMTRLHGNAGMKVQIGCSQFGMSNLKFQWLRSDQVPVTENQQFYLGEDVNNLVYSSFVHTLSETDDNVTFTCITGENIGINTTGYGSAPTCSIGPFKITAIENGILGLSVTVWMSIQISTGVILIISIVINILFIAQRCRKKTPSPHVTYEVNGGRVSFPTSDPPKGTHPEENYDNPAPDDDPSTGEPYYDNTAGMNVAKNAGYRPHGAIPIFR
ncbi:uncharacterized protein [Amphiura filiformis]|uniref:uncharacterized protein n=1 Tax=Amphiura filiformis TaxID=82378 RepID=UPI003B21A440